MQNNIKRMLEERGWSQAELARRPNCYPQQVSRLIRGDRGLSQFWIEKLSEVFNVDPSRLLMVEKKTSSLPSIDSEADERMMAIQLLKQIHAEEQKQTAAMEEQTGILQGIAAALLERP